MSVQEGRRCRGHGGSQTGFAQQYHYGCGSSNRGGWWPEPPRAADVHPRYEQLKRKPPISPRRPHQWGHPWAVTSLPAHGHKPTGSDGVNSRVLKELAHATAGPLSIICQSSWQSVQVPTDWKLPSVIPIDKRECKGRPRNLQTCESDLSTQTSCGEQ